MARLPLKITFPQRHVTCLFGSFLWLSSGGGGGNKDAEVSNSASSDTVPTSCLKFKLPTQSSKSNGHRSQTNKPEGGYGVNLPDQSAAREGKEPTSTAFSHGATNYGEPIHHIYRMLKGFASANRGFLAQFCSLPLPSLKFTIRVFLGTRNKTTALLS